MKECRQRALLQPLCLAQNWPVAVLIFLGWMAALEWGIYYGALTYGSPPIRQHCYHIMAASGACGALGFALFARGQVRKEARRAQQAARQPLLGRC